MFIKQNMQICMIKKITACLFEYEKYASRVRTSRQSLVAIFFFLVTDKELWLPKLSIYL
jgi:hypothetical protein